MLVVKPYLRENALMYANRFALSQNPIFGNFAGIGGNCTNFVSQCIYAGSCRMNYKPTFGWYYISMNERSPSWTGVEYFYNFITTNADVGPFGRDAMPDELEVGDVALADKVVQHDMNTTALGDAPGLLSGINIVELPVDKGLLKPLCEATAELEYNGAVGTIASGDLFVAKQSTKDYITKTFDAIACEMEGAAIGHVAYVNEVPFAVLRVISDGGDGMEFTEFVKIAAERSVKLTKKFLELWEQ